MKTMNKTTQPIITLKARPERGVRGSYEGTVYVHARNGASAGRVIRALGLSLHDEHTFKIGDVSVRDPYRGIAYSRFSRLPKSTMDALLKRMDYSYVSRSAKITDRELDHALNERVPFCAPTFDMWRTASASVLRGFSGPTPDWMVEKWFMGSATPDTAVEKAAYALMKEENLRRAALANKK